MPDEEQKEPVKAVVLPPKPIGMAKAGLIGAVIAPIFMGISAGAVVLATKLPGLNKINALKTYKDWFMARAQARDYVTATSLGVGIGVAMEEFTEIKYNAALSQRQLQREVDELKADKAHAMQILEGKPASARSVL